MHQVKTVGNRFEFKVNGSTQGGVFERTNKKTTLIPKWQFMDKPNWPESRRL